MRLEAPVRRANAEDAGALAAMRYMLRAGVGPTTEHRDLFVARCTRWMAEHLSAEGSNWLCWVAEDAGRLIGQVWLSLVEKVPNPSDEPELHGYVTNLYVVPENRGFGIGGRLLAVLLETCRDREVDSIILWSTKRSKKLYERSGFTGEGPLMERRRSGTRR
jgi:GNAT superfamily N-acetyltransferase